LKNKKAPIVAINDIGTSQDFLNAVNASIKNIQEGDILSGILTKVSTDEVLVDIGFKSDGVIPLHELSIRKNVDPTKIVNLGELVEVKVLKLENIQGDLILSLKAAKSLNLWKALEDKQLNETPLTGIVIEVVNGGLIVDIGIRGFLPASLIELKKPQDLTEYLGQELMVNVIEIDKLRNTAVLSRKAILAKEKAENEAWLFNSLKKGQVYIGNITSIVSYGAFVKTEAFSGLIHISQLSRDKINDVNEIVSLDDEVEVEIVNIDLERNRVSLILSNNISRDIS
jgi:small subunit ribosomal protein S1